MQSQDFLYVQSTGTDAAVRVGQDMASGFDAGLRSFVQSYNPIPKRTSISKDETLRFDKRAVGVLKRLSDLGSNLHFDSSLLFDQRPRQWTDAYVAFWKTVLWHLLIPCPSERLINALECVQRDLLGHLLLDRPGQLSQGGFDVLANVTVGLTLLTIRHGVRHSRRKAWWSLRATAPFEVPLQQAFFRVGRASFGDTLEIVRFVKLQAGALHGYGTYADLGDKGHVVYQLGLRAKYIGMTGFFRQRGRDIGFPRRLREHLFLWCTARASGNGQSNARY